MGYNKKIARKIKKISNFVPFSLFKTVIYMRGIKIRARGGVIGKGVGTYTHRIIKGKVLKKQRRNAKRSNIQKIK